MRRLDDTLQLLYEKDKNLDIRDRARTALINLKGQSFVDSVPGGMDVDI
jgi:hypothetical protein